MSRPFAPETSTRNKVTSAGPVKIEYTEMALEDRFPLWKACQLTHLNESSKLCRIAAVSLPCRFSAVPFFVYTSPRVAFEVTSNRSQLFAGSSRSSLLGHQPLVTTATTRRNLPLDCSLGKLRNAPSHRSPSTLTCLTSAPNGLFVESL